jgi:hypothetical protein
MAVVEVMVRVVVVVPPAVTLVAAVTAQVAGYDGAPEVAVMLQLVVTAPA